MSDQPAATGSHLLLRVLLMVAPACFNGCGGDPTPAPQPQQQAVPAERPQFNLGFAPRKKVEEETPELDLSGVAPENIFEQSDQPLPNFTTAGTSTAQPTDQFVTDNPAGTGPLVAELQPPTASASGVITPLAPPPGFVVDNNARVIDGFPEFITNERDGSRFVLIPAGPFTMGSDSGPDEASPAVTLELDAYYISLQEITLAQFERFRRPAAKAEIKLGEPANAGADSSQPVLGLTWAEVREYVAWAGCELPTEAQWEKAARGPNGFKKPWGDTRPLWRAPRVIDQIDSIGRHPDDRSPYGVMDMAGNAREWVLDFYDEQALKSLSNLNDAMRRNWSGPRRASETGQRVVKGNGPDWVVWHRYGQRMTDREPHTGFRCVLNVPAATGSR